MKNMSGIEMKTFDIDDVEGIMKGLDTLSRIIEHRSANENQVVSLVVEKYDHERGLFIMRDKTDPTVFTAEMPIDASPAEYLRDFPLYTYCPEDYHLIVNAIKLWQSQNSGM